ncbi:MAG: GTPase ObgE [Elusimicrobia bacterium]|nr:GTPase ObgE [Elusimicrobiota bacterium]
MVFLDRVKIMARAGHGGKGCVSFRREKYVPRGGPDGGDGGKGGNVYLESSTHYNTLFHLSLRPHLIAERGEHGRGSRKKGASGKDVFAGIPVGTSVYETDPNLPPHNGIQEPPGRLLGELLKPKERLMVARGGQGGRGNEAFKSNKTRAPRYAEPGEPGEEKTLVLELKLLADVGLVGLPNAGKSSLLAALTAARPKVAAYPFTTISPVLGVCSWKNRRFVLADIPGLIEGAHAGRGLGHEFLRHVERTSVLLHVIEPKEFGMFEDLKTIERELDLWQHGLSKKSRILVVTKKDSVESAQKTFREIRRRRPRLPAACVSSVTKDGLAELQDLLLQHVPNRTT